MLEIKDYKVDIVENGKEAIEIIKNNNYDVILMDIKMPIMDGEDATKEIRKIEFKKGKHTPIIALTAYALKGDSERFLKSGMDYYLSKPVYIEELHDIVNKAIDLGVVKNDENINS